MDHLKFYVKNKKGLESFIQAVWILKDDIGMEFGIDKMF